MPKSRMRRCSPLEQKPVLLTRWPLPPDPTPRCQSRSRRRWQATERHRSSGWARYPSPLYANIPLDHLENLSGAPTSPIEAGTVHRQPAGAAACRRRVPRSADGHPLPWAGGDHDLPLVTLSAPIAALFTLGKILIEFYPPCVPSRACARVRDTGGEVCPFLGRNPQETGRRRLLTTLSLARAVDHGNAGLTLVGR